MKKIVTFLLLIVFPLNVFAYSDKIYRGGNTVGIEINSNGILVVGFYEINGKLNRGNPILKVGDYILKVNDKKVNSLKELTNEIENNVKNNKIIITYRRDNKEYTTNFDLINDDGIYKTGLYVKDSIIGIGTLTYVDPNTNIYGALGHEIVESNTNKIVEIKSGEIFRNVITSIDKSKTGYAGSKNAKYFYNTIYGSIIKNTNHGIFGIYNYENNMELIDVGSSSEVKIGNASMYTVIDGEKVEEFDIYINKINENSDTKNIIFEIIDNRLLDKTGGIVQGMSGSPIVQNNKIVGVITHVIVDNPLTGYGLFITQMLEEGEK